MKLTANNLKMNQRKNLKEVLKRDTDTILGPFSLWFKTSNEKVYSGAWEKSFVVTIMTRKSKRPFQEHCYICQTFSFTLKNLQVRLTGWLTFGLFHIYIRLVNLIANLVDLVVDQGGTWTCFGRKLSIQSTRRLVISTHFLPCFVISK